jgi:GrpB-like predicted nucleotidyltransferase (UPF0157 family)
VTLTVSDKLLPMASAVFLEVCSHIAATLPAVEVHHIGATAIPGALTKGDLDVVLRVEAHEFQSAVAKVRAAFAVKQPENWEPCFASFGSDQGFAMPVGVQVVIKESEADFFLFVRDFLISNPDALADYNHAKQESFGRGDDEYWAAKDRVLARIIALKPKKANQPLEPTTTAVTIRADARLAPAAVVAHL